MNRRTFLTGSALGGAALLTVGGRADAAEWTALERANVKVVNDFIAARVALRNRKASLEEWNKKMAEFAVEDLMFTAHSVGDFKPQVKIAAGPGPFTHITMTILETFAKGPVVMHERVDVMSFADRPDSTGRFTGIFALKDGKIHEFIDYHW